MKLAARRIVCATDFSPNARSAADVAAAIALRLRATLVLVHVADQAHVFGEGTKDFRLAMRRARTQLRKEADRLRGGGTAVEPVLLHGRWAEHAVGELVAKAPPLLVVVSSVSKTTFDRWTLGSTSEHIAQHAPVPTLVVRTPDRLLNWAHQERRLNVVVAVDFTVSSDAALEFVKQLQKVGPCGVTVAHINWPPDEIRWSPGSRLRLSANPPRVRRRLLGELRRKVNEHLPGTVEVHLEPNWGRPDAALVYFAGRSDADLIVVGTHQRPPLERVRHGSTSRGVLRHAMMNVACVPVSPALAHGAGLHPRVERVLIATNLSPSSDQAIPWGYAVVAPGGSVKLVHVVEPMKLPSPLVPRYDRSRAKDGGHHVRIVEARDKLAALVPATAGVAGVRTEVEIVDDRDPAHGIGMAVRRFRPDLICLAAKPGATDPHLLVGSVLRQVIAQNRQPVLLVRPEDP